jgi:hypothetical protein
MSSAHKEQFNKVLNIARSEKGYFSTNPKDLNKPELIKNTNIYVETHLAHSGYFVTRYYNFFWI